MDHTPDIQFNESNQTVNNWLVFIGGFIFNLLFLPKFLIKCNVHQILEYFLSAEFGIFFLRSIVGSLVALLFKLLYDFIKRGSKSNISKGGPPNE